MAAVWGLCRGAPGGRRIRGRPIFCGRVGCRTGTTIHDVCLHTTIYVCGATDMCPHATISSYCRFFAIKLATTEAGRAVGQGGPFLPRYMCSMRTYAQYEGHTHSSTRTQIAAGHHLCSGRCGGRVSRAQPRYLLPYAYCLMPEDLKASDIMVAYYSIGACAVLVPTASLSDRFLLPYALCLMP